MRFAVLVLAGSAAAASTAQLDARQAGAGAAAPTDCVAAVKSALAAVPSAPSQLEDKLERTGLRPNNCGEFSGLPKDVEAEYNGYRSSLLSWMNSFATSLAKCPGAQDKLREKLQDESDVPASCLSNYPALQTFFPANPTGGSISGSAGQATATASTGGAKATSTATGQAASAASTLATAARSGQASPTASGSAGLGSSSSSSGGLSTSTRVGLAARETGMAMAAVAAAGLALAVL